jgi:hypothetical protein
MSLSKVTYHYVIVNELSIANRVLRRMRRLPSFSTKSCAGVQVYSRVRRSRRSTLQTEFVKVKRPFSSKSLLSMHNCINVLFSTDLDLSGLGFVDK